MAAMASPTTPAQMRAYIVERLVGETGEPDHVRDTARALVAEALPDIVERLAALIGAPAAVELTGVELTRFTDARAAGDDLAAMSIVALPNSADVAILTMDAQAVAIIVNALFGGDPDQPVTPIDRALSPTEIDIAGMAFEAMACAINALGTRTIGFPLPLPRPLGGAELSKQVIRDGPSVRVDLAIASKDAPGRISLMLPQRVLSKKRADMPPATIGAAALDTGWSERFGSEVMRSSVMLEATMPLARLTLSDVAGFYPGQIIELEENAKTEAKLSARHKTLFICEFGKLGLNYTVRVRHAFDARQDLIDGLMPG